MLIVSGLAGKIISGQSITTFLIIVLLIWFILEFYIFKIDKKYKFDFFNGGETSRFSGSIYYLLVPQLINVFTITENHEYFTKSNINIYLIIGLIISISYEYKLIKQRKELKLDSLIYLLIIVIYSMIIFINFGI